jgi:exosome complex component RRP42
MSNNIVSRLKRKKIQDAIEKGHRMDQRGLTDYREFKITPNPLYKVEGSAEVYLGKTHVIVGVKIGEGTPFEDTPDEGVIMVNAEFTPGAHPTWEPGPPREAAVELARVVDRGLRSAEILDMKKLSIISGKKVWLVFIDLFVLNYDGNLIDACAAGAMVALLNTKKQMIKVSKGEVELLETTEKLKILKKPIAVTMVKIGENLIVDPTADEEEVMDTRLTITLDQENNITTLQKSGSMGLTTEEIKKAISLAVEKSADIRKIVEESASAE